jgi:hypothetical protein
MPFSSRPLVDVLRCTLLRLEENPELDRDDPHVIEFRDCIHDSIDELEYRRPHAA